jgi:tRNA threonylcarbamoyl adenosine modification protein YeaZ
MIVLASEFSREDSTLALLEGEKGSAPRLVAEVPVNARDRRSQSLFPAAEKLLAEAGVAWSAIDAYAVGIGPGSYTGLRVSITAARGWALPQNRPVWTCPSAAALAAECFAGDPSLDAAVIHGDARRGTRWAALYRRDATALARQEGEFVVLPEGELAERWPGVARIAEDRAPRAEWVGRLFFAGGESGPLSPIYMNPAVQIAPRFDAEGRPVG